MRKEKASKPSDGFASLARSRGMTRQQLRAEMNDAIRNMSHIPETPARAQPRLSRKASGSVRHTFTFIFSEIDGEKPFISGLKGKAGEVEAFAAKAGETPEHILKRAEKICGRKTPGTNQTCEPSINFDTAPEILPKGEFRLMIVSWSKATIETLRSEARRTHKSRDQIIARHERNLQSRRLGYIETDPAAVIQSLNQALKGAGLSILAIA